MLSDMTLIVRTARHRYAVRRDDVSEIKLVADASVMANDEGGRPYLGIELGPLLDPEDRSSLARRRALIIPLRRRLVDMLPGQVVIPTISAVLLACAVIAGTVLLTRMQRHRAATLAFLYGTVIYASV